MTDHEAGGIMRQQSQDSQHKLCLDKQNNVNEKLPNIFRLINYFRSMVPRSVLGPAYIYAFIITYAMLQC